MLKWTVYRVRSLHNGGAGQSLERLGSVDAQDWATARRLVLAEFAKDADSSLPMGGFLIVQAYHA